MDQRNVAFVGVFVAVCIGIAVALVGGHHFNSNHTRLSDVPRQVLAQGNSQWPSRPAHVVVVVEENKEFRDIAGKTRSAPYLNELIGRGALFTRSYGIAHPSQPNYTALFAGVPDTNGDHCPPDGIGANAPNLATELRDAHRTFAGYAEDLPQAGSRVCWSGEYARKHVPWADFENVLRSENLPLTALPSSYDRLPTVAFIIPNLLNDMHSASIARGDAWLRARVGPIVDWARNHDTLVIVTWDESDDTADNHIPTLFVGPMVKAGPLRRTDNTLRCAAHDRGLV
jgi:acid phosphatase